MQEQRPGRGTLVLVVGPSGAGKDALINGARERFAGDPVYRFPRRLITRPAGPGEDHIPTTATDFIARAGAGEFLLWWEAHGLHYALPRDLADELETGRHVVANVSRTVIEVARLEFPPTLVIEVTAPAAVLAERLKRRGRENASDIAERLRRAELLRLQGPDVQTIVTDQPLAQSIEAFCRLLNRCKVGLG